ncbi:MAG: DUF6308 family protein [Ornithinimicrobium sp.]|uniref:DUF6308 family protein n=1 Tax=Ornithinimicrobium sp. TaxID=1977084 RepID=UPI003D9BC537
MGLRDITDAEAVKRAIAEYDRLGEAAFLEKYGVRPAKDYHLVYEHRRYASKAIAAAAHGHQHGTPLRWDELRGGKDNVAPVLRALGFDVRSRAESESIDLSPGMVGGIGTVTLNDAVQRTTAFCTSPTSGWQTYDLAGPAARAAGHFDELAPWSLLWADALAGRLSVPDLAGFTLERREDLAARLAPIPRAPLADLNDTALDALTLACRFGYPGVWAPKITKMLALYRPEQVPVLDGYVAIAMGFERTGFSEGREPRWARILATLSAMRSVLREQAERLAAVRERVREVVPHIDVATDLRLLDIIIWTSQDDRMSRPGSAADFWLNRNPGTYAPDPPTGVPA